MKSKSLFQSFTCRGAALAALATVLAAIAPTASKMASRHLPNHRADIEDLTEIVLALCGLVGGSSAVMAIAGRVNAGNIYTPRWMPGPNPEDFEVQIPRKKIVQNPDDAL